MQAEEVAAAAEQVEQLAGAQHERRSVAVGNAIHVIRDRRGAGYTLWQPRACCRRWRQWRRPPGHTPTCHLLTALSAVDDELNLDFGKKKKKKSKAKEETAAAEGGEGEAAAAGGEAEAEDELNLDLSLGKKKKKKKAKVREAWLTRAPPMCQPAWVHAPRTHACPSLLRHLRPSSVACFASAVRLGHSEPPARVPVSPEGVDAPLRCRPVARMSSVGWMGTARRAARAAVVACPGRDPTAITPLRSCWVGAAAECLPAQPPSRAALRAA